MTPEGITLRNTQGRLELPFALELDNVSVETFSLFFPWKNFKGINIFLKQGSIP